jgi:3-hydroxyacyl-[acyl-carrier-protein] dehydratase
MPWDKAKIESILPHREPFLFIDEVVEIDGTKKVVAVKNIKDNERYFEGHIPGRPIMPGVLIIEAMAQASIILYSVDRYEIAKSQPNYYLGKVKAEFLAPVYPEIN